ncbi:MAG: hypothetical protein RL571_1903 [Pseudomonadota bacterium]|jgi:uncharacterized protein (DUF779 family)
MANDAKVSATPAALDLITKLAAKYGELMFHQSGGCCDGSSPMCFQAEELITGDSDVLLGHIGGMFSLEGSEGLRFLTRTKLCPI